MDKFKVLKIATYVGALASAFVTGMAIGSIIVLPSAIRETGSKITDSINANTHAIYNITDKMEK